MTFLELMNVRKTDSSNILLYMFQNPREYREYVNNYINLLNDLHLVDKAKKYPDRTVIDLKTGIKMIILLNSNIQKLYGYRYYNFRLFGNYEDFIQGPMPILGELFKDD